MKPIKFPQANKDLGPPKGMTQEECNNLPIFSDGKNCISVWELTDDEIEAIKKSKKIYLSVNSGWTQPPVLLLVEKPFVPPFDNDEIAESNTKARLILGETYNRMLKANEQEWEDLTMEAIKKIGEMDLVPVIKNRYRSNLFFINEISKDIKATIEALFPDKKIGPVMVDPFFLLEEENKDIFITHIEEYKSDFKEIILSYYNKEDVDPQLKRPSFKEVINFDNIIKKHLK